MAQAAGAGAAEPAVGAGAAAGAAEVPAAGPRAEAGAEAAAPAAAPGPSGEPAGGGAASGGAGAGPAARRQRRKRARMDELGAGALLAHPLFAALAGAREGAGAVRAAAATAGGLEGGEAEGFPARAHAALELCERHLAALRSQLDQVSGSCSPPRCLHGPRGCCVHTGLCAHPKMSGSCSVRIKQGRGGQLHERPTAVQPTAKPCGPGGSVHGSCLLAEQAGDARERRRSLCRPHSATAPAEPCPRARAAAPGGRFRPAAEARGGAAEAAARRRARPRPQPAGPRRRRARRRARQAPPRRLRPARDGRAGRRRRRRAALCGARAGVP